MARPQVADRGDGLQKWRVATNILNKQSRTASGGPPAWGLVEGLTTPHRKKRLLRILQISLGIGQILWCETWSLILREGRRLRVFENEVGPT